MRSDLSYAIHWLEISLFLYLRLSVCRTVKCGVLRLSWRCRIKARIFWLQTVKERWMTGSAPSTRSSTAVLSSPCRRGGTENCTTVCVWANKSVQFTDVCVWCHVWQVECVDILLYARLLTQFERTDMYLQSQLSGRVSYMCMFSLKRPPTL